MQGKVQSKVLVVFLNWHVLCKFRLVEDDFLMAREREDGHVYFTGGLVAFPGTQVLRKLMTYISQLMHRILPALGENQQMLRRSA